jgi:phospholipid-binding lipoprotein MlaA
VLPLLGPSTLRDGLGLVVDRQASPSVYFNGYLTQYAVTGVELIALRANLLSTTQLLDQVALDRYSFVRQAYLARRMELVFDGAAPMEKFDDDPGDSEAAPASPKPAASAPK